MIYADHHTLFCLYLLYVHALLMINKWYQDLNSDFTDHPLFLVFMLDYQNTLLKVQSKSHE